VLAKRTQTPQEQATVFYLSIEPNNDADTYPAVVAAYRHGRSYGDHIREGIIQHIAKGIHPASYYETATLGDLLAGNDGE
jgi:hypothetical protein